MAGIFVYSDNIALSGELIALVKEIGQDAYAISFDESEQGQLLSFGANTVYVLKGDSNRPEDYSKAVAALLQEQDASAFFAGATIRGRELAALVAGRLDCGLVSDASQISLNDGKIETIRMMYGGATALTESLTGMQVVTIPAGKCDAVKSDATGKVEVLKVNADTRVRQLAIECVVSEGVDITKAKRLVCVGMGFDKKEDLKIAEDMAVALEGEIGATRPITEDREWLASETYIGLSGAVIRPELYIGLGVSGQIQHTYGIRDSKIIVAINNNEKATIFQVSDYGIVGDLYEIAPLLTEAIKKARA